MTRRSTASARTAIILKLAILAALAGLLIPAVGLCAANPLIGSWKYSHTTSTGGAADCNSS